MIYTSAPTGFLAAFMEVVPVGERGDSWSISGLFTGTGIEGIELFLDPDLWGLWMALKHLVAI